jgi:hypothetical protein
VKEKTIIACYKDMLPIIIELLSKLPANIATMEEIKTTFTNNPSQSAMY